MTPTLDSNPKPLFTVLNQTYASPSMYPYTIIHLYDDDDACDIVFMLSKLKGFPKDILFSNVFIQSLSNVQVQSMTILLQNCIDFSPIDFWFTFMSKMGKGAERGSEYVMCSKMFLSNFSRNNIFDWLNSNQDKISIRNI